MAGLFPSASAADGVFSRDWRMDLLCFNLVVIASGLGAGSLYFGLRNVLPLQRSISKAAARNSLPHINLSRKVFFSHIHKASGASFIALLRATPGMHLCRFVSKNAVSVHSVAALADWWFSTDEQGSNCSLVTMEHPPLGRTLFEVAAQKQPWWWVGRVHAFPQLITFIRDPAERCASHWLYEQRLCNFAERHSSYCHGFLRRFGASNDTGVHEAFATNYCSNPMTSDFARYGVGDPVERALFHFIGFSEYFATSVCLFWFQADRYPMDRWASLCECQRRTELNKQLPHITHAETMAAAVRGGSGTAGVARYPSAIPALRVSRDQLHRRNERDLSLYRSALQEFEWRVRLVERQTNVTLWSCRDVSTYAM